MLLRKDLIRLNVAAETSEEALRAMAQVFVDTGVAKESYPDAIVLRESKYPTGLPVQDKDFDIATPHTFAEHVNEEAMGVCVLQHPVQFQQMGTPEITLHPQILLMLAIVDPQAQIKTLRKIMKLIQNPDALSAVRDAKTPDEVYDILSPLLA